MPAGIRHMRRRLAVTGHLHLDAGGALTVTKLLAEVLYRALLHRGFVGRQPGFPLGVSSLSGPGIRCPG